MKTPARIALTLSLIISALISGAYAQAADRTTSTAAATEVVEFSQAQLDAMLAPIALYPDTVLSHVLIAATYPLEVVQADRWVREHKKITGEDAVNAVEHEDWDPSVKALVAFPDILRRMSDDLDWTQRLGDAFLASEERVMDSIQTLRNRAYASGNLDKVEHVRVVREEKVIVIEPSVERVVYVPAYDTRVVYGNWWWPDYPPVYWNYPSSHVFVSGFYWGPRVHLSSSFYFSSCHWRDRRVVVIDHHHHHRRGGPRFYDGRSIARYEGARHWNHNPVHRRGVAYHDNHTRDRFHSPRESYRDSHHYRQNLRQPNANVAPNRARDLRQQGDRREERFTNRQPGDLRNPRAEGPRNGRAETGRDLNSNAPSTQRAERLRERMEGRHTGPNNQRADNNGAVVQGRDRDRTINNQRWNNNDTQRPADRTITRTPRHEAWRGDGSTARTERNTARDNSNQVAQEHRLYGLGRTRSGGDEQTQPRRVERAAPQRIERSDNGQRFERPPRNESFNRAESRPERHRGEGRPAGGDSERRGALRGGREI